MRFVLVHSPLVGPTTVAPIAAELERRAHVATAPDLRAALDDPPPQWRGIVERVAHAVPAADVVVGHSGAGVLVPEIADRIGAAATVFVDAVVPPANGAYQPGSQFVEFVSRLPGEHGRLPPWHEWWGDDVMADLVADVALRRALVGETPRVPLSFYDHAVALPPGWMDRRRHTYLQLSPAYDDDRERAQRAGWPTLSLDGRHLDLAVRPGPVCDEVLRLLEASR